MANTTNERSLFRVLLSVPLRFKITIPYLVLAALLAGLASYQVARSFVETLEERFRGQLEDASFRVADGILDIEEGHLGALRSIAFTLGVPEAVGADDLQMLEQLVYPQIVNNRLYFVDILDVDGERLASWHRDGDILEYAPGNSVNYPDWQIVRSVVEGQVDELGDKYSEVIEAPWGTSLYTAGPIILDDEIVGIVLVGSPLQEIVPDLAINSLANITVYGPDGQVEFSTLGEADTLLPIGESAFEEVSDALGEYAQTRTLDIGSRTYIEALETLYLRTEPSGWYYSVALPESLVRDTGSSTILPLMVIFILGVVAMVLMGIVVAQIIAVPVFRLLRASRQVGGGDFQAQVDVYADDEIGQLTEGFNHMVNELRQREFVREMFGRMVSEDVSEAVLRGDLAIGGEERHVSVLFTDVRGFTSMSERFSPDDVISLLNQFFAIITAATRKYHGVINHFGGDSVLAVFGAPIERDPKESLSLAIYTAMEIRKGIVELNAERISKSLEPLRYGVGINSGTVIAGNVGTEDRFHYTVIGDVVNVAARLQGISRQFPRTPLLIPETSVQLMLTDELFEFQYLGEFRLKGKEKPVPTYATVSNNQYYPSDFTLFDEFPYPKTEALLTCYLYCKGYPVPVIADTLQIGRQVIERWLEIAANNLDFVGPVLIEQYQLSPMDLSHLEEEE